jgi:hypothetical protein
VEFVFSDRRKKCHLFESEKDHVASEQFTAFVRKAACPKARPDDTTTATVTSTSVTMTTTTVSGTSTTTATVTSTSVSITTTTPTTVTSVSITESSTTTVAVKTKTTAQDTRPGGDIDDNDDVIMVDEVDFTLVRDVARCYLPRQDSAPDSGDFFKKLLGLSLGECASAVAADPFCGATFHGRVGVCYCVAARLGCDIKSSTRGDAVYVLTNSNKATTSRARIRVTTTSSSKPPVTPSTTSVSATDAASETDDGSGAGDEPTEASSRRARPRVRNSTHLLALLALCICIPLIIFAIYRCSSASDSDRTSEKSRPLPPPPMLLASGTTAVNSEGVFVYGDDYDEPSPDFFYTGSADELAPPSPTPPLVRSGSWLQPPATLHFDGGAPPLPSTRREVFTPLGEAFYSVAAHDAGGGGGAPSSPAHDAGAADTSAVSFV